MKKEVSGKRKMPDKAEASDKKTDKEPDDDGPYQSDSDSDTSVSFAFPHKINSKAMPRKAWQKKSDIPDHSATASSSASAPADKSAKDKKGPNKQEVKAPPKRETSKRAKDMMRDADVAKKVYGNLKNNFVQDFASI
jgi:hypothetical protein